MPCHKDSAPSIEFGSDSFSKRPFLVRIVMPALLKFALVSAVAGAGGYAQGPNDAREVLLRVKQAVMDTVQGLPKYVCTQTIDRSRYEPDSSRFDLRKAEPEIERGRAQTVDRLRC